MDLLNNQNLENSPVVANNRMNRERNAVGINSYEKDIDLSPVEVISQSFKTKNTFTWLDICCGRGKALIQTAQYVSKHFPSKQIAFTGIDLIDMFDSIPEQCNSVSLHAQSFFNFESVQKYDLITCVHGLHYMGDKLEAIRKACSMLNSEGLFIANFDTKCIKSIEIKNIQQKLSAWFKFNNIEYSSKKHLVKFKGIGTFTMPFQFVGADDKAGPNYTGQEAVDSFYK
ncbi:MAG: methyltransferase domain-containing protein [Sporocytophaga sp.]|uniref:methyltransferase domain-containing protein n=1 Tax=Sporocytophaga sp. TaxID=2231183 RepID=UPI001B029FD6|nr:methyltransferase domain-containing protein [Sporocytophaga sp.]MBO9702529.1 methyltransferase domain-containing protein [Sporocytophaga sp.]